MKVKLMWCLVLSLGVFHSSVWACGKSKTLHSTHKNCKCPRGELKSNWTKKFKRNKLDMVAQCKMAAKGARFFCGTKGKVVGFQYKVIKRFAKKIKPNRYEGYCKIKYHCRYAGQKHSALIRKGQPFPGIRNDTTQAMGSYKVIRKDYETKTPNHTKLLGIACKTGVHKLKQRLKTKKFRQVKWFEYKMYKKSKADWNTYYYLNCHFNFKYTYLRLARRNTYIYWCTNK